MGREHRVRPGECIDSIAYARGLSPEAVWDHAENRDLRARRKDRNVLAADDVVVLPERAPRAEPAATERRHRFVRKGLQVELRLAVLRDGVPRSDERYKLILEDGHERVGTLDGDGALRERIRPDLRRGTLLVGSEGAEEEFDLAVGGLEPVTTVRGLQGRLDNLGYDPGPKDDVLGPLTRAALAAFQADHGLEVTGEPDDATSARLDEVDALE